MKFLEFVELTALQNCLQRRIVGDMVFDGRVEAYSFKTNATDKRKARELLAQTAEALGGSFPVSPRLGSAKAGPAKLEPLALDGGVEQDGGAVAAAPLPAPPRAVAAAASLGMDMVLPEPSLRRGASFDSSVSRSGITEEDSCADVVSELFELAPRSRAGSASDELGGSSSSKSNVNNTTTSSSSSEGCSPLDLSDPRARRLYAAFVATLNCVFPDYEYSDTPVTCFEKCNALTAVVSQVNTALMEVNEEDRRSGKFAEEVRAAVASAALTGRMKAAVDPAKLKAVLAQAAAVAGGSAPAAGAGGLLAAAAAAASGGPRPHAPARSRSQSMDVSAASSSSGGAVAASDAAARSGARSRSNSVVVMGGPTAQPGAAGGSSSGAGAAPVPPAVQATGYAAAAAALAPFLSGTTPVGSILHDWNAAATVPPSPLLPPPPPPLPGAARARSRASSFAEPLPPTPVAPALAAASRSSSVERRAPSPNGGPAAAAAGPSAATPAPPPAPSTAQSRLLERMSPGGPGYGASFLDGLWAILHDCLGGLPGCEVYAYTPQYDSDPANAGALWWFAFFLVSSDGKRLIFFTVSARSALSALAVSTTTGLPAASPASSLSPSPLASPTSAAAATASVATGSGDATALDAWRRQKRGGGGGLGAAGPARRGPPHVIDGSDDDDDSDVVEIVGELRSGNSEAGVKRPRSGSGFVEEAPPPAKRPAVSGSAGFA